MSNRSTRKPSSGKRGDIKTTLILVLLVIVAAESFYIYKGLNNPKKSTAPTRVVADLPKKTVPYVPAPVVAVKKKVALPVVSAPGSSGKIAFILDDWGYGTANCKYLKEIKAPLAIAVLPNLRHTVDIANCAHENGKTVMLHLPLEPYANGDHYPDNYLITSKMKPSLVAKLLKDSLVKLPYVEGVNNHMGSKAMESEALIRFIFKQLKGKGMFFVDSMTSPKHSVGTELAEEIDLPFAKRDIFLDNVNVRADIEKQISLLAERARKKGYAIAIGHDRTLTLQVIQEQVPLLQEQGFTIVSIKDLLKQ